MFALLEIFACQRWVGFASKVDQMTNHEIILESSLTNHSAHLYFQDPDNMKILQHKNTSIGVGGLADISYSLKDPSMCPTSNFSPEMMLILAEQCNPRRQCMKSVISPTGRALPEARTLCVTENVNQMDNNKITIRNRFQVMA